MEEQKSLDTLESTVSDHEIAIVGIQNYISDKNLKAKVSRDKYFKKMKNKEGSLFIKQYIDGAVELSNLIKLKSLSFSDLGKFFLMSAFLQKDTGMIVSTKTNCCLSGSEIAAELGEVRQNFNKVLQKFIKYGLVTTKKLNGKTVYYINPEYCFNGPSRKDAKMVFNNCVFGSNANISIIQ